MGGRDSENPQQENGMRMCEILGQMKRIYNKV